MKLLLALAALASFAVGIVGVGGMTEHIELGAAITGFIGGFVLFGQVAVLHRLDRATPPGGEPAPLPTDHLGRREPSL